VKLIYKKGLEWQRPVLTEEKSYHLLKKFPLNNEVTYLAAPWSTLIDSLEFGDKQTKTKASTYLKELDGLKLKNAFTVCQHEKFHQLLPFFKKIGVTTLFASHMVEGGGFNTKDNYIKRSTYPHYLKNIRIETSFLHPVVVSPPFKKKDILYSFVGSRGTRHISPIRNHIFEGPHSPDSVVIERNAWQFDAEVYQEQIQNTAITSVQKYINNEKSLFYGQILSRSRFSLCPSGTGPTSIRFLESLGAGAIPLIFSDSMMLPSFKGISWEDCSLKIAEKDYNNLTSILKDVSPKKEQELRLNGLRAAKRCTGEAFVDNIRSYYNDCTISSQAPPSRRHR
jgi:hypothetical protein|tara:strand:+ start:83 stop:1096 length:1014 start_codon:yes stop_codon:yes gene_type:complete